MGFSLGGITDAISGAARSVVSKSQDFLQSDLAAKLTPANALLTGAGREKVQALYGPIVSKLGAVVGGGAPAAALSLLGGAAPAPSPSPDSTAGDAGGWGFASALLNRLSAGQPIPTSDPAASPAVKSGPWIVVLVGGGLLVLVAVLLLLRRSR